MTPEITVDPQEPQFYFCLEHGVVEEPIGCRGEVRLGPFATFEEASRALEITRARTQAWDEEDRRWEGEADSDD